MKEINADHILTTSQDFKRDSSSRTNTKTYPFPQFVQDNLEAIKNIHRNITTVFHAI